MDYRVPCYIAIGFATPIAALYLASENTVIMATATLPLIALIHELLHLMAARIRKVPHRFITKSAFMIGLLVNVKDSREYIALALTPQIVTLVLLALFVVTGFSLFIVLALFHTALSLEDIARAARHLSIVIKTAQFGKQ